MQICPDKQLLGYLSEASQFRPRTHCLQGWPSPQEEGPYSITANLNRNDSPALSPALPCCHVLR